MAARKELAKLRKSVSSVILTIQKAMPKDKARVKEEKARNAQTQRNLLLLQPFHDDALLPECPQEDVCALEDRVCELRGRHGELELIEACMPARERREFVHTELATGKLLCGLKNKMKYLEAKIRAIRGDPKNWKKIFQEEAGAQWQNMEENINDLQALAIMDEAPQCHALMSLPDLKAKRRRLREKAQGADKLARCWKPEAKENTKVLTPKETEEIEDRLMNMMFEMEDRMALVNEQLDEKRTKMMCEIEAELVKERQCRRDRARPPPVPLAEESDGCDDRTTTQERMNPEEQKIQLQVRQVDLIRLGNEMSERSHRQSIADKQRRLAELEKTLEDLAVLRCQMPDDVDKYWTNPCHRPVAVGHAIHKKIRKYKWELDAPMRQRGGQQKMADLARATSDYAFDTCQDINYHIGMKEARKGYMDGNKLAQPWDGQPLPEEWECDV